MSKLGTMPQAARDIIMKIAELRGADPRLIVGKCRKKKIFRARIEVTKRLADRGYSSTRIGKILNHDHTTIVFYLGRGKKKPSLPIWRTPKVRHVRFVKPPPPPKPIRFYLKPYAGADMTEYQWKDRQQVNFEENPR